MEDLIFKLFPYFMLSFLVVITVITIKSFNKHNRLAKSQKEAKRKAQQKEIVHRIEEPKQSAEQKQVEWKLKQDEWNKKHGRLVIPVAGVTFDNDDGTSRQRLLKDIKVRGGDAYLELQEYEYKNEPAIRITVDGECIGNVPKTRVKEVSAVLDSLENARLDIERFCPEDEDEDGHRHGQEIIYRADLILIYSKAAPKLIQGEGKT